MCHQLSTLQDTNVFQDWITHADWAISTPVLMFINRCSLWLFWLKRSDTYTLPKTHAPRLAPQSPMKGLHQLMPCMNLFLICTETNSCNSWCGMSLLFWLGCCLGKGNVAVI